MKNVVTELLASVVAMPGKDAYLFVGDGYVDKNRVRFVPALYLDKIRFVERGR